MKQSTKPRMPTPSQPGMFEKGLLLGIFIGEGHFGGDGKQPQLTLKLHVRHETLLRRLVTLCPGGRLYGPYHHGERHYFQLMYRGNALRDHLIPLLDSLPWPEIDPHSYERYASMKVRYAKFLAAAPLDSLPRSRSTTKDSGPTAEALVR